MGVSINNLIASPEFAQFLTLVAGCNGTGREISHISVIDTPLIPLPRYSLNDNVFVLSSFYLYKDNEVQMLEAIKNLDILGASAIGIKRDMYVHCIPQEIIDYCNSHDFPLFVTTDKKVPFRRLISTVEDHIKTANLKAGYLVFDDFISGKSRASFKQLVNNFQRNFVCISADGKTLFKNVTFDHPTVFELEEAFKKFLNGDICKVDNEDLAYYNGYCFFPCYIRNCLEAVLVFYNGSNNISVDTRRTAKALTAFISLQLMENFLMEAGKKQAAKELATSLILNDYPNEEIARQKFSSHGYSAEQFYRMLLFSGIKFIDNNSYFLSKNAHTIIINCIQAQFPKSLCLEIDASVLAIIPVSNKSKFKSDSYFSSSVHSITDNLSHISGLTVRFSQLQSNLSNCSRVYRHLKTASALDLNEQSQFPNIVKDLDIISVLIAIKDSHQDSLLEDLIIIPIQSYDSHYNYSLMQTLTVCMSSQSLEKAAARLHIHYSTLRYRLQKIHEVTGYSFFNFQDKIMLFLACILWQASNAENTPS